MQRYSLAICAVVALSLGAASAQTLDFTRTTIDDTFTAYISTNNGTLGSFFYSGGCCGTSTPNATFTLTPGQDYFIHIVAINYGGAAGWGGQFTLSGGNDHFLNGTTTEDTAITPSDWLASDAVAIGTSWTGAPLTYAALPESNSGNPYAGSGLLWSPGPNAGSNPGYWNGQCFYCQVDFSTEIVAPTPEPGTMLLLGSGVLGLASTLRRKINRS